MEQASLPGPKLTYTGDPHAANPNTGQTPVVTATDGVPTRAQHIIDLRDSAREHHTAEHMTMQPPQNNGPDSAAQWIQAGPSPKRRRGTGRTHPVNRVLAVVTFGLLALVLLGIAGGAGWLGIREWHRNTVFTNQPEFAFVEVTTTWYGTNDPTYTWRGPVADGVYRSGSAINQPVRVEHVIEKTPVGEQLRVRRGGDDPSIAQSNTAPITTWHDVVPWVVLAFALVPLPPVIDKFTRYLWRGHTKHGRHQTAAERDPF